MEGLHPADILIHMINITVLFFLLRLILWKPVTRILDMRAQRIQADLQKAEDAMNKAEKLKQQNTLELERLESAGQEILQASRAEADKEAQRIKDSAQAEAKAILDGAREKIEREKNLALSSARNEVVQLARDMAANVLKREVTPADNMSTIDDFFDELR